MFWSRVNSFRLRFFSISHRPPRLLSAFSFLFTSYFGSYSCTTSSPSLPPFFLPTLLLLLSYFPLFWCRRSLSLISRRHLFRLIRVSFAICSLFSVFFPFPVFLLHQCVIRVRGSPSCSAILPFYVYLLISYFLQFPLQRIFLSPLFLLFTCSFILSAPLWYWVPSLLLFSRLCYLSFQSACFVFFLFSSIVSVPLCFPLWRHELLSSSLCFARSGIHFVGHLTTSFAVSFLFVYLWRASSLFSFFCSTRVRSHDSAFCDFFARWFAVLLFCLLLFLVFTDVLIYFSSSILRFLAVARFPLLFPLPCFCCGFSSSAPFLVLSHSEVKSR